VGGYIVQQARHWIFANTGLGNGDVFGGGTTPPLVGYECDGAPLQCSARFMGAVDLAPNAHECGTPPGFTVLAACLLDREWQELPYRERWAAGEGIHAATMGIHSAGGAHDRTGIDGKNGIVFTAGTTDWSQVLVSGQDRAVEKITRNVLDRLGER